MNTISIIIPVYNSAEYLPDCLDSVLAQTYREIEIILVEDGSTDDSPQICEQYAQKDSRIQVIDCPRKGPGAARNLGIQAASGTYILFVDSDDLCEPRLTERLLSVREKNTLVLCGIQVVDEQNNPREAFHENAQVISVREYALGPLYMWSSNPLCGGVYSKLYDRSILQKNNILFEEDSTYAEDFCFNLSYLRYVETVVILPDLLYRYRCGRAGSLTEQNLKEMDFSALWTRRLEVVRQYEEMFAALGLKKQSASAVTAFMGQQTADMIRLSLRRSPDDATFRENMELLKKSTDDLELPYGVPDKDRLSLRLLGLGRFRTLRMYEQARRFLRRIRGRERWDS